MDDNSSNRPTIANSTGGLTQFSNASTADNATITSNNGMTQFLSTNELDGIYTRDS